MHHVPEPVFTPKSLGCILPKIGLKSHFLVEIFWSEIWRCSSTSKHMDIMWTTIDVMWKNNNYPCVNMCETLGYVRRGTRHAPAWCFLNLVDIREWMMAWHVIFWEPLQCVWLQFASKIIFYLGSHGTLTTNSNIR